MSRITKYALSDLYEMSSGISSTKEQAGHGAPFVSFSTVFNNYFLPDELFDLIRNAWYILMPERRYICRIILIQGQIIMRHCLYHLKHHTIE